jgi:hypothetical protein
MKTQFTPLGMHLVHVNDAPRGSFLRRSWLRRLWDAIDAPPSRARGN